MKKCIMLLLAISLLLTLTQTSSAETEANLPSLKDFYADSFDFGSAVSSKELQNAELCALILSQYSIITPENELKPENVIDEYSSQKLSKEDQGSVAVYFHAVKPLLNFAKDHGLKVHGHVLFWHQQTPDTFFRESYSRSKPYVTREVMLERMENYVRLVMEYMNANYPGVIVSWDVVNEAIDDSTGKLRESNFTKIVGDDFVLQAFRFARKYAPEGTLLFYNDYSTPYQPKLDGILGLLEQLQAENLVDGHGLQCHYQLTTPTTSQINLAIHKITAMGLLVRVSELDILVDDHTDAQFTLQAKRYQDIMKIFLQYPEQMIAVQTWGYQRQLQLEIRPVSAVVPGEYAENPPFMPLQTQRFCHKHLDLSGKTKNNRLHLISSKESTACGM